MADATADAQAGGFDYSRLFVDGGDDICVSCNVLNTAAQNMDSIVFCDLKCC